MKFTVDQDELLVSFLQRKIGCSISKIKKKIKYSNITIDGELNTTHNPAVKSGQIILLDESSSPKKNISILFEDDQLIAVEKPVNLLTMGTGKYNENTLYQQVNTYIKEKSHNRQNAHIIHRLDREVSGILLFAKNKKVQEKVIDEWYGFEKKYYAIVEGVVVKESETLTHWLKENKQYHVYVTSEKDGGKKSITSYNLINKSKEYSLLEVFIQTGRKNQIRVQLSEIGHSIIGDQKFGAESNPINRLGLHAFSLKFNHPVSNLEVAINTEIPVSFAKLFSLN
ncbi:MAG: RNA pseudouridine synthase [Planctomycetota bacterium]|nr:MAG: RNA pseudouridine synthase [Planctomycetota bacterium]